MASGYEQSPDYGGPEWDWRDVLTWALVIIVCVAAFALWRLH